MSGPPGRPDDFCAELVARLDAAGAERPGAAIALVGCYLHGSAVLGGWHPAVSDVDLLVVVRDWSPGAREVFVETVSGLLPRCPGRGLECSVVHTDAAREPAPPWPFLLHVDSTGDDVRWVEGTTLPGDPDLLMHYAVARRHGRGAGGPPADEVFGDVPRAAVLGYLHDELGWALTHGSEAYAVLNAARAIAYAHDGSLLSKLEAGSRAVAGQSLPPDVVRRALRAQQADAAMSAPGTGAAQAVRQARAVVAAASGVPDAAATDQT